jgi:hypothetical protein
VRDMEDRRRPARISAKECMPRYNRLQQTRKIHTLKHNLKKQV